MSTVNNYIKSEPLYFDRDGKIYNHDEIDYLVDRYELGMSSRGVPKDELYNEADIISIFELVEIDKLELLHEEGYFIPYSDIRNEFMTGIQNEDPNYTQFESIGDYISALIWHNAACMWIDSKVEIKTGWFLVECHNDREKFSIVTNGDGIAYYL